MITVPNILTLMRLAALPFVIVLFRSGRHVAAGIVFVVAMLTDCLDGWLAKRLKQETRLGLYLDPVVDKILVLVLFYELARAELLAWPVAHLFLVRELLQNGVRSVAALGGEVVGANWMGKLKAFLQSVVVTWGLVLPATYAVYSFAGCALLSVMLEFLAWSVLVLSWAFSAVFVWSNRGHLQVARAAH